MTVINLNRIFVYGTLRPGESEWARSGYTADPVPATATGMLYSYGAYPYADFDGEGTIIGAVLSLDDDAAAMVYRVESGAGYTARLITATYADGTTEEVASYDASETTKQRRLPVLPVVRSGDWVAYERENRAAYERR